MKSRCHESPTHFAQVTFARASLREFLGEFEDAVSLAREVRRALPDSAAGWLLEGRIHQKAGNQAKARRCLRESYELAPEEQQTALHLSVLLALDEEYEELLEITTPLHSSNDAHTAANAAAFSLLALRRLNRDTEAEELFETAVKRAGEEVSFALVVAKDLQLRNHLAEAAAWLRKADAILQRQPDVRDRLELGEIAYHCNLFELTVFDV